MKINAPFFLIIIVFCFQLISSNEIPSEVVEVFGGNRPQDAYNFNNDLNSNDINPNLGLYLKKLVKSEFKKESKVHKELQSLVKSHERKIEDLTMQFSDLNTTFHNILTIFQIMDPNNLRSTNYQTKSDSKRSRADKEVEKKQSCLNQNSGSWKYDYESGKLFDQNPFKKSECNSYQIHLTQTPIYFQLSINVTENPAHYGVFKVQMLNCENSTNDDEKTSAIEYKLFSYKSIDNKILFFSSISLHFGSKDKSKIEKIAFPFQIPFLAVWTLKLDPKEMSIKSYASTPGTNVTEVLVSSLSFNISNKAPLEICGVRVEKTQAIWPLQTQLRSGRNEGTEDIEPFQYDNFLLSTDQEIVDKRRDEILEMRNQTTENKISEGASKIEKEVSKKDEVEKSTIEEPKEVKEETPGLLQLSVSHIQNHFKTASTSITSLFDTMKSKMYTYGK